MGLRGPGASRSRDRKAEQIRIRVLRHRLKKAEAAEAAPAPKPKRKPRWMSPRLSRAARVIAFIQSLRMTRDRWAGKPFRLRVWQKDVIRKLFVEGPDRKRLVREALLTIARKNGKSELASALCLVFLVGPEAVIRGEVYAAAQDKNLAGRIFENLEAFIKADPELWDRTNIKRFEKSIEVLSGPGTGSYYKTLSADESKGHGLNPIFVVLDELAQWKSRLLYDNIMTGFGAREEPLALVISTKSSDPHSCMGEVTKRAYQIRDGVIEDPSYCPIIYEVQEDCANIWDESVWPLANPALGDFRSLAEMRAYAAAAKRFPSKEVSFRRLYLNQTVDDIERAIPLAEWRACQGPVDLEALRGMACWGGLDLSSTTDLTSLVLYFPDSGAVLVWFWLPAHELEERARRDEVPYVEWRDAGLITTTAGRAINRRSIAITLEEILSLYDVRGIGYDRGRIEDLLSICQDEGLDHLSEVLQPFGQGYMSMSPAYDATEIAVLQRDLVHDGNPVLQWQVSNVVLERDAAENRKPVKNKSIGRIDGFVSLCMSIGMHAKAPPEETDKPFSGMTDQLISGAVSPLQRSTRRAGRDAA